MIKIKRIGIITIISIILLMVLVVQFGSAPTLTSNSKSYYSKNETVVVKNASSTIANLRLLTPRSNWVADDGNRNTKELVAEIEIEIYDNEYANPFKEISFYNKKDMKKKSLSFEYKYKSFSDNTTVNDYGTICVNSTLGNSSIFSNCTIQKIGTHQVENYEWKVFTPSVLKKGKAIVGIFTDVKSGETTEWIPDDWFGINITEWSEFTGYTRYEWSSAQGAAYGSVYSNSKAQTFRVGINATNETFTIKGVNLFLGGRIDDDPRYNIEIQGVDTSTGKPNGTVLVQNKTWNCSVVSTGETYNSFNITVPDYILQAGGSYAIVLRWNATLTSLLKWQGLQENVYPGGEEFWSSDGGSGNAWLAEGRDFHFEVYGVPYIADSDYPLFTNNVTSIANGSQYSSTSYEFNITITNTNTTAGIEFNGVNYTITNFTGNVYNKTFATLGVGAYKYYYWAYGNGTNTYFNRSREFAFTVLKNSTLVLGISGTTPIIYPTVTDVGGSKCPAELTCTMDKVNTTYGVGSVIFNYSTPGNTNYSATDITKTIVINLNTTLVLGLTATTPISYGTTTDFTGSLCPGELTCSLNITNAIYKAGTISANYSTAGDANYSASSSVFTVTINQAISGVNTYLNGSRSNLSLEYPNFTYVNGTLLPGVGQIKLYNNNVLINQGNSPIFNNSNYTLGLHNITTIYEGNENYTVASETWWINSSDTILPVPQFVSPTDTSGIYVNRKNLIINLSVIDTNFINSTLYLYNSTGLVDQRNITTRIYYANITNLADGIYYFNATATDVENHKNYTETRNVTIDTTPPVINIIYPGNNSIYSYTPTDINYTLTETNPNTCWYSLNNGTNISFVCGQNITGLTSDSGYNRWIINVNDSANNRVSSYLTFFSGGLLPWIAFESTTDANNVYVNRSYIIFNITVSGSNLTNFTVSLFKGASGTPLYYLNLSVISPYTNYNGSFTSLLDDDYYMNSTSCNILGGCNSTETRHIIVKATIPSLQYTSNTASDYANLSQTNVFIEVNFTDTHPYYLNYTLISNNGTTYFVNKNYTNSSYNFTGLAEGINYSYFVIASDFAGNLNQTPTRRIFLDILPPNLTIIGPTGGNNGSIGNDGYVSNGSYWNNGTFMNLTNYFYTNIFNNSLGEEILTFIGGENITRYLRVPQNIFIFDSSGLNVTYNISEGIVTLYINDTKVFIYNSSVISRPILFEQVNKTTNLYSLNNASSLAQTFTVGVTGLNETFNLSLISLYIGNLSSGDVDINIEIQYINATGYPNGSIIVQNNTWNATSAMGIGNALSWINITMPIASLNKGQTYAIVQRYASGSAQYYLWGNQSLSYAGGRKYYNPSGDPSSNSWFEDGNKEASFMVWALNDTSINFTERAANLFTAINSYISICPSSGGFCYVPFKFNLGEAGLLEYSNLSFVSDYDGFGVNVSHNAGIKNVSLYIYNTSGTDTLVNNQTTNFGVSVIDAIVSFPVTLLDGIYNFFFNVYDWAGNTFVTGNNTLTVDANGPNINITYPTSVAIKIPYATSVNVSVDLNWSLTSFDISIIDTCWYSINGGPNTTIACFANTTTNVINFSNSPYNITFYARSRSGAVSSRTVTPTFGYYILDTQPRFYNNFSWETQRQSYVTNVSYDSTYNVTGSLSYDGVIYPAQTIAAGSYAYANATIDVPTISGNISVNLTKGFYWIFNLTYTNGTLVSAVSTYSHNQTVGNILFESCDNLASQMNTTGFPIHLNISFKDEISLAYINQSLERLTTDYFLGSGSSFNSLTYNNITASPRFQFCSSVPYYSLNLDNLSIQYDNPYSTPVYFSRNVFYPTKTLVNTTTNIILYNILQSQGSYTTFYMTDLANSNPLADVKIVMETTIEGNPFGLTEFTDSAGVGTFWVNPNAFYTVTMSKTGCDTKVATIRPTQASYGFQLNCAGVVVNNGSNNFPYTSPATYVYDGLSFTKSPRTGILSPGNHTFEYQVTSMVHPMTRILMILYYNGTILKFIEQNVSANLTSCTSSRCYVNVTHNLSTPILLGAYYVDFGAGYLLLENDGQWINIRINSNTSSSLKSAITDFSGIFDSYTDAEGMVTEAGMKAEFSRIVWVFLILAILFAFFNKYSGYDSANPGAFLIIMTIVIFLGSAAGGLTGNGFFYISNIIPEAGSPGVFYALDSPQQYMAHFINNYLIFGYMLLFLSGYWLSVSRRQT
ncbi:hypothetical protein M0R04_08920 [Candidatus Dojkabacteria bacterium]|jgi:hypothetical protein|nr:hypothetical protein [Candidatus Dojkabacteria bacterium]